MRLIFMLTAICSRVFDYAFVNRFALVDLMDVLARRDGELITLNSWATRRPQILPFCERHTLMQPDTATIEGDCPITGHREAKRNDNTRRAVAYYVTEQTVSTVKDEEDVLAKENAP
jgi:hypothetical protein